MIRLIPTLALIALTALPARAADPTPEAETTAPRPVTSAIVSVEAGAQQNYVGVVAAHIETDLGFPMIGTIAERPAETGDLVSRGDVLARLDPEDLDADVRAAEAGVAVALAQLRSAQSAEARARELAGRGVDSATRLEDAERALTAAEAQAEQARAALARAEDIRSFATLSAPQDGVIVEVFAEPGATLSAGEPVLTLAGIHDREVVIDLSERDVAGFRPGIVFDAILAADPTIHTQATLTRIDPVAERTTRTRRLHLTLSDPPAGFRLGTLVRVRPAADTAAVASIDFSALLDPDTAPAVWRVDRSTDTVHRQPVTLGERFGDRVQVSDGLSPGDEIVIKGIHSLKEGQSVGPRVIQ